MKSHRYLKYTSIRFILFFTRDSSLKNERNIKKYKTALWVMLWLGAVCYSAICYSAIQRMVLCCMVRMYFLKGSNWFHFSSGRRKFQFRGKREIIKKAIEKQFTTIHAHPHKERWDVCMIRILRFGWKV